MAESKTPRPTVEVEEEREPEAAKNAGQETPAKHAAPADGSDGAAEDAATDGAKGKEKSSKASLGDARKTVTSWLASNFPGHENAVFGGIVGLIIAIMVFVIGFWQTLFISVCVLVGVAIGQYLDGRPTIVNAFLSLFGNRE